MPGFSGKNSDLQGIAKRAQNTLTSHLLMPQGVLEIKSNPVQKDEKKEVFKAHIIIITTIIIVIIIYTLCTFFLCTKENCRKMTI